MNLERFQYLLKEEKMNDEYIEYKDLPKHIKVEKRKQIYSKFKQNAANIGRGLKSATIKTIKVTGAVARQTKKMAGNVNTSFNQVFPQQPIPKKRIKSKLIKPTIRKTNPYGEPNLSNMIQ